MATEAQFKESGPNRVLTFEGGSGYAGWGHGQPDDTSDLQAPDLDPADQPHDLAADPGAERVSSPSSMTSSSSSSAGATPIFIASASTSGTMASVGRAAPVSFGMPTRSASPTSSSVAMNTSSMSRTSATRGSTRSGSKTGSRRRQRERLASLRERELGRGLTWWSQEVKKGIFTYLFFAFHEQRSSRDRGFA